MSGICTEQEQAKAHPFEVEARKAMEQCRAAGDEEDAAYEHPDRGREVRTRYQVERQVEDEHGQHAEVDVVVAIVIGHVEERFFAGSLLEFIARALVVGVIHLDEPFGRPFFQVELTPCHGFRKLCILLRVVTAHLEERDGRFTVPRS